MLDIYKKILALSLLSLTSSAFAADFERGHVRDTWYIGFGIGGGFGESLKIGGQNYRYSELLDGLDTSGKAFLNFKVGSTLSPNLLLGFDATALGQSGTNFGADEHVQINNYFAMLTYFPVRQGFFLRGGGGWSAAMIQLNTFYGDFLSTSRGFGALVGMGYAFWLGKTFNLTVNLDHSRQFYDNNNSIDNSKFTALYLGFDWY